MRVIEAVSTISGEYPCFGVPITLIRLADCNLNCRYCDADLTKPVADMSLDDILQICKHNKHNHVLITGGEPLMDGNTPDLLKMLNNHGFTTILETNGTKDVLDVSNRTRIAMDVKLFDPKLIQQTLKYVGHLSEKDCIKLVYDSFTTFRLAWWVVSQVNWRCPTYKPMIVFSPADKKHPHAKHFVRYTKRYPNLDIRMQVQLHKVVGMP